MSWFLGWFRLGGSLRLGEVSQLVMVGAISCSWAEVRGEGKEQARIW